MQLNGARTGEERNHDAQLAGGKPIGTPEIGFGGGLWVSRTTSGASLRVGGKEYSEQSAAARDGAEGS